MFLNWFKRKVEHIFYYWDFDNKSQDETELKPSGTPGLAKYEINVSKKGRHVFATDRTIRNYDPSQIRDLVLLFREKFPESEGYKIVADSFWIHGCSLDYEIQAALEGRFVKTKIDKKSVKEATLLDNLADPTFEIESCSPPDKNAKSPKPSN